MPQARFRRWTTTRPKTELNRALDTAIRTMRNQLFYPDWHADRNVDVLREFDHKVDTVGLYLHVVPGRLAKAVKLNADHHPYIVQMKALLAEVAPLAAMMATLKDKVVKRQPKPAEEKIVGYKPPPVSTEAERQVVALLEQITQAAYDELKLKFHQHFGAQLALYLQAQDDARTEQKYLSPVEYFIKSRKYPDHFSFDAVNTVVVADNGRDIFAALPKKQVATKFDAMATEFADRSRHISSTNFKKIASIVEAKGNYLSGEAVSHTVSLDGLAGTLIFQFRDGAQFTVVNQVVCVVNSFYTRFNRFPLTFHAVILPNGTTMPRPSEERMNTIFAKMRAA